MGSHLHSCLLQPPSPLWVGDPTRRKPPQAQVVSVPAVPHCHCRPHQHTRARTAQAVVHTLVGKEALLSSAQGKDKRHQAQLKYRKLYLNRHKNHFNCKGGQVLVQDAQTSYGGSMFGDTQNPIGCGPEQAAPAEPAMSRGLNNSL